MAEGVSGSVGGGFGDWKTRKGRLQAECFAERSEVTSRQNRKSEVEYRQESRKGSLVDSAAAGNGSSNA